ncbi:hypothetical protein A374_16073 [Fictibacillus macauensis ZFHKF-1]|uniref:Uncharacterized protein n=1 Tax=Fictibacillus macauensis ZFHKF-1 TaxID=1196324 RepID=I8AG03_9BACL|nr:hypothetical protein [Fictibacillus macauensis]EIT84319.1 hypothetical protein A374_16073 [Fictibacillus macauensis ZFHKF-1]
MKGIRSVLYMHWRSVGSWVYIPWLILGSVFLINYGWRSFHQDSQSTNDVGNMVIFIYLFTVAWIFNGQLFAFASGLSIKRMHFVLGSVMAAILISIGSSLLLMLLIVVENMTNGWGIDWHTFSWKVTQTFAYWEQFAIYLLVFLCLILLGFFLSSIVIRFRKRGLLVFGVLLYVFFLVISNTSVNGFDHEEAFWTWIGQHGLLVFYSLIPAIILLLFGCYMLFMRRAIIRS